jgi:hypothetical protein
MAGAEEGGKEPGTSDRRREIQSLPLLHLLESFLEELQELAEVKDPTSP